MYTHLGPLPQALWAGYANSPSLPRMGVACFSQSGGGQTRLSGSPSPIFGWGMRENLHNWDASHCDDELQTSLADELEQLSDE